MDRAFKARLEARFGATLTGPVRQRHDETEMRIAPGDVVPVLTALHDEPDLHFEFLADLAGVDTGEVMQVVYHLWSETTPDWLRVIADGLSRDDPRVPSATFLWKGAEWMEREAYDMFGIIFEGNRDLRRIYMPPDYASFPLRKDFFLPDDAARSPGGGVRPMERTPRAQQRALDGRSSGEPRHDDQDSTPVHGRPAGHARSRPRRLRARSRRTRRGPSARPSSTRLADGEMLINMGPQHPSTHGVLRVVLKLDGEKVVDLDPVLGYLHRGVEKLCENADYHQAICYTDPLEYVSALFNEWAPVMAFEKLLDVAGPAPRRVHPRAVGRAEPDRQPRPVHGLDGAGPGWPDADPVVVHRARRDRGHAGRPDRPADAVQLLPHRRA